MWQKNEINRSMAGIITAGTRKSDRVTVEWMASLRLETTKVTEQP